MKLSQRLCSVLLCLALLFPVFSINVNAEEVREHKVTITHDMMNAKMTKNYTMEVTPNNEAIEKETLVYDNGIPAGYNYATSRQHLVVEYKDGSVIMRKNRKTSVTLHNVFVSALMFFPEQNLIYDRFVDEYRVLVYYGDGSSEYRYDGIVEQPGGSGIYNFTLEFTPKKDITKIEFLVINKIGTPNGVTYPDNVKVEIHLGEFMAPEWALSVTQQSEEASLLTKIIEWLSSIKDGITDGFDAVKNGITNIINNITELPSKIWQLIENGLKSLFVPSEDSIIEFKEDIDLLLAERLGAVYEVVSLTFDSWDSIQEADKVNTIEFPDTTINLPNNQKFTFGGYEVRIVPTMFTKFANTVKTAVGIVCTIAFVNGLRKRYDEIMGVEV